jgi:hypothetical protein
MFLRSVGNHLTRLNSVIIQKTSLSVSSENVIRIPLDKRDLRYRGPLGRFGGT